MAGQLWSVSSLGGYFYSLNLSQELRTTVQPMLKFAQFADVKDATMQGKQKGQTFTWDVVGNVSKQGSQLVETVIMPESNFTITQGTLTISEAGNSVPYTGMLEALSQFSVREPVMKALKNDSAKFFDILTHAQLNSCVWRVCGSTSSTITTNTAGTCTNTNSQAFNKSHLKLIMDLMRENNVPSYTGDDYIAIAWPSTFRQLKNDIESLHTYTESGIQYIYNGEIGRYETCRFTQQTNIPKGGAADSTTWNSYTNTADAWNGGYSDWIFFIGEEAVAEAIAVPQEVRAKIPTDYGRSKGVAWYWLGGEGLVYTSVADTRVYKWDSAV